MTHQQGIHPSGSNINFMNGEDFVYPHALATTSSTAVTDTVQIFLQITCLTRQFDHTITIYLLCRITDLMNPALTEDGVT